MKIIEKKSVAEIPQINGAVVDTFNVENKTTNAPSVRAVEEKITEVKDITSAITSFNASISSKNLLVKQYGKIISLDFTVERSGNWTSVAVLFTLPDKLKPITSIFFAGCGGGNSIKNFNINAVTGEVKILGNVENSNWISGHAIYLCEETTD